MRIGIVRLYCGKSGAQGYYNSQEIGLAKALELLGYECVVFYPDVTLRILQEEKVSENIRVVWIPAKSIGVHAHFNWALLQRYEIDIVQINSDNQLFAPGLSRYCENNGIRQYHYIGTVNSDRSGGIRSVMMRMLFRRNLRMLKKQQVFAKTNQMKKELENRGISGIKVAPVGLDMSVVPIQWRTKSELRESLQLPQDKILLLFVGRIEEYKNPLEAVRLLKELPEQYELVMIGTGALDGELMKEIESVQCRHRVKRLLQIPNSQMYEYYRACDYFVNFNRHEIFGMSILEAMMSGSTVLAYHAPGPDEIIADARYGVLVDSILEMKQYILSGKRCDEESVREYVQQHFAWERTASIVQKWIQG